MASLNSAEKKRARNSSRKKLLDSSHSKSPFVSLRARRSPDRSSYHPWRGVKKRLVTRNCIAIMDAWWPLIGAAIPAIIVRQIRAKRRRGEEQRLKSARGREKNLDEIFVCERVCTSKRMLKKAGAFSKDPILDTCLTVCGVSEIDACADACARTVCVNQHQVPNWNDICLKRCQSECLRLSSSSTY